MNRRDFTNLYFERDAVIREQSDLFAEIKANSKDPERTGELLSQVTDSAVRYNDLSIAFQHAIFKTKASYLKSLFLK